MKSQYFRKGYYLFIFPIMLSNIIGNFGYLQPALPKVLDEEEMDEEEEPIDEENYSTTLIDYVSVNLASMQEIEKIKKQNP